MTERELLTSGLAALSLDNPQAVDKLLEFSRLLLEKNKVMNLTAVTDPMEVVTRHFLDCAVLAPYAGGKVIDVGCGAGFPGIPLALLTGAEVTLLDSLNKRIAWLGEVIEALQIPNASAVHARAEEFGHREMFDLAVSRAVARLNVLAELSLPLVRVGGRFLAMKADDCAKELDEARHAVSLLGGDVEEVRGYTVPKTGLCRKLVVIRKIAETPAKYPRRYAKISAQPL
mgnify:CR=1 FL=1